MHMFEVSTQWIYRDSFLMYHTLVNLFHLLRDTRAEMVQYSVNLRTR